MPRTHIFSSSAILALLLVFALGLLSGCLGKQTVPPADGGPASASQSGRQSAGHAAGQGGQPISEPIQEGGVQTASYMGPSLQSPPKRGTKPYTVMGKTYYPLLSAEGFREEGIASWYGKDFHGKQTANGERYDMYGLTAAHKLLPFGTQVKVTNRTNGKSVVVRINDRGPFVDNRVIDLTHTGAKQIGMLASGTAPVIVESVGAVKGLHDGLLDGRFYIQVGAFGVEANASNLVQGLRLRGYGARAMFSQQLGLWRVQVGPYKELGQAESMSEDLKGEFKHNFIVAD